MEAIITRQPWAKEKAGGFTASLLSGNSKFDIDQSLILD
jgi:hypothetical protein